MCIPLLHFLNTKVKNESYLGTLILWVSNGYLGFKDFKSIFPISYFNYS